jgi:hypothetical protein
MDAIIKAMKTVLPFIFRTRRIYGKKEIRKDLSMPLMFTTKILTW